MPCEFIKYSAETLAYDRSSSLSISPHTPIEEEYIGIFFMYATTEIKVITEELLINFSNFVSSVGGNLGMFIGFSCFGVFSWTYDLIKEFLDRKRRRKPQSPTNATFEKVTQEIQKVPRNISPDPMKE